MLDQPPSPADPSWKRFLGLVGLVIVGFGTAFGVAVGAGATWLALTFADIDAEAPDWGGAAVWALLTMGFALGGAFLLRTCWRGFRGATSGGG